MYFRCALALIGRTRMLTRRIYRAAPQTVRPSRSDDGPPGHPAPQLPKPWAASQAIDALGGGAKGWEGAAWTLGDPAATPTLNQP
jgi:hypothetical protein